MTDIEMTKLCAEAMGFKIVYHDQNDLPLCVESSRGAGVYDPLKHDAEAMALIKRFGLVCDPQHDGQDFANDPGWEVWLPDNSPEPSVSIHPDLNRAIVECVAKMQGKTG